MKNYNITQSEWMVLPQKEPEVIKRIWIKKFRQGVGEQNRLLHAWVSDIWDFWSINNRASLYGHMSLVSHSCLGKVTPTRVRLIKIRTPTNCVACRTLTKMEACLVSFVRPDRHFNIRFPFDYYHTGRGQWFAAPFTSEIETGVWFVVAVDHLISKWKLPSGRADDRRHWMHW